MSGGSPQGETITRVTIRLVATDLDGTLLRGDGTVSERTQAALRAVEAAGILVVFVTGRPLRWAREVFDHVGSHGRAIVSNGALVWDVGADLPLLQRCIEPSVGRQTVAELTTAMDEVFFAVETVAGWACEPGYPHHPADDDPANRPLRRAPAAELVDEPLLKLLVRGDGRDPDDFVAAAEHAVGQPVVVTHSSFPLLEISAPGVTKASTLELVCADLGITRDEVIAFGDMPNDLPMLAWAGRSYAMANAHATVREAADVLADTNDNDGVAKILEELA